MLPDPSWRGHSDSCFCGWQAVSWKFVPISGRCYLSDSISKLHSVQQRWGAWIQKPGCQIGLRASYSPVGFAFWRSFRSFQRQKQICQDPCILASSRRFEWHSGYVEQIRELQLHSSEARWMIVSSDQKVYTCQSWEVLDSIHNSFISQYLWYFHYSCFCSSLPINQKGASDSASVSPREACWQIGDA